MSPSSLLRLRNVILVSQATTSQNKPGLLNLSPAGRVEEAEEDGSEGREKGRLYIFYVCVGVWGLQWEKYQPHYGVGLSLPSLSMRGRGLSDSTKGEKAQEQTENHERDGWMKEKRGGYDTKTKGGIKKLSNWE